MRYDVHNHLGLDLGFYLRGWWPYAQTSMHLIDYMDAHGIDKSVVFPFGLPCAFDEYAYGDNHKVVLQPGRTPFDRENPLLLQEIERIDPEERLLMLAMFDPGRQVPDQVKRLEKLLNKSKRVIGLKVQATILETPINQLLTVGRPLMELASERNLPVLIHTSILPSDGFSPAKDCLDVAGAFPKVRFNMAHSIRFHLPSLKRAAQMPNVWVDNSAHLAHCWLAVRDIPAVALGKERVDADYSKPGQVLEIIDDIIPGKYMWGSDSPFHSWCDDSLAIIQRYKAEADVIYSVRQSTQDQMFTKGPEAWLFGKKS
jgi:hypothetical protein